MRTLDDFSNHELIEEIEDRGYRVNSGTSYSSNAEEMKTIFWEYQRGNLEEALFLLEREFPELSGLAKNV